MLTVTLEQLQQRMAGTLPELLEFEVVHLEPGLLRARMPVTPSHLAPNGYLHAASVIALADTSCGMGTIAHLPGDAESFTTVELKSNFLGTARGGWVCCEAKPAHLGRTTQVWDATVRIESNDRVVALFRCTQMVLWRR